MSILSGALLSGTVYTGQIGGFQTGPRPVTYDLASQPDFLYLADLLIDHWERQFITDLRTNPEDRLTRNALADWLEEKGRTVSSQLVRHGYTPGGRNIIISGTVG